MKKIKYIPQIIQTECALCCIAMISRYYGNRVSINDLRDYFHPSRDGISAKHLCEILTWIGFEYKAFKGSTESLVNMEYPLIIFWKKNHFIILEKIKNDKFYVVDPALGKIIYDKKEFDDYFSNILIYTKPNKNLIRKKKEKSVLSNYLFILKQQKLLIFSIILFSILTYGFSLYIPILVRKIIDNYQIISFNLVSTVLLVLIGYCISILLTSISKVIFKTNLFEEFSKISYEHLTKISYKFFDMRSYGNILFSLDSIRLIKDLYAEQMINVITSICAVLSLLIYILVISKIVFYFVIILLIFAIVLLYSVSNKVLTLNQIDLNSATKLKEIQTEFIYSILNIKISGIEKEVYNNWKKVFDYSIVKSKRKDIYNGYYSAISSMIQIILPIIILFLGIFMVKSNDISFGVAISFYWVATMLAMHSVNILFSLKSFAMASQYMYRITDILSQEIDEDGKIEIDEIYEIEFHNVSFQYAKQSEMILKNISMKFRKGEKIAIVGGSGSGKSTIAKLLIGLYKPVNGHISYNKILLNEINKTKLKKIIGMVPQENILFNKSIKDNILIDRNNLDINYVKLACEAALIKDDIEKMPMKYETLISDTGTNISGGQKQRIILARAIASNPQLLILDEATSSLDSVKEQQILENLKLFSAIQIVIAHRLTTIKDSDRIYVLDNGEVVEIGTHDELMSKNGKYTQLYMQSEGSINCNG